MFSVTQGQIDRFNEDGVLIVDGLIGDETVDKLRACYERLFRGDYETGVTPDEVNWREGTGELSLTRRICNGWKAEHDFCARPSPSAWGPWSLPDYFTAGSRMA